MKLLIRLICSIICVLLVPVMALVAIGEMILPDSVIVNTSQDVVYNSIYKIDGSLINQVGFQRDKRVSPSDQDIKLLGFIPVKKVAVFQQEKKRVYVSGESFGIKLYTDGVIVVGTRDVDIDGAKCNPAKESGIIKGDIIIQINGEKMYSSEQVTKVLNDNNGKVYNVRIKRNGNIKNFELKPVYSKREGCYKVGLWVRDSTAGIGTVTFYNPVNKTVAALGHPITDVDTNEIMPILDGEAVKANVTKIYKGVAGEAGALGCDFTKEVIGTLKENNITGIYGKYVCTVDESRLYEIAPPQEVVKGSAQLLCTVDDKGPQLYNVEISHITYRDDNSERNMVVKIKDNALLNKTGGIVQGMSGSPIIQNGKLVGALTHVVVDNPKKGYAIFAQRMLEQSESFGK